MSTVASRTFRSTPHRSAPQTWAAIVNLLTQAQDSTAKKELDAVAGIAISCIADQAPKSAPIIVTCHGPRTRIYCIYDDEAIDGSNATEDTLGFDPLMGSWSVSLPCITDDLQWVQSALKKQSTRITARDLNTGISDKGSSSSSADTLTINHKGLLGR